MESPRLIKKYANRRLYDTVDSRHVTLSDLRGMIVSGTDIRVVEETSGEDITRSLLLQIIVDRERAGQPLLSEMLLAQLIRFHGNPMQGMMADYLQRSVDAFLDQQRNVQTRFQSALSSTSVDTLRELMRSNAAAWEAMMGLSTSAADGPEARASSDQAHDSADARGDRPADSRADGQASGARPDRNSGGRVEHEADGPAGESHGAD